MEKEESGSEFSLYELSDDRLNYILSMPEQDRVVYIGTLIKKFYPKLPENDYTPILIGYDSSFIAEKIYRSNKLLQEGFTVVYTKTGMIRNIINDRFFTDDDLIIH